MNSAKFNIIDPLGENEYLVELPTHTIMKKLLPELTTALGLEKGSYILEHVDSKRILGPEETLSSIDTIDGNYLRLLAAPVAAGYESINNSENKLNDDKSNIRIKKISRLFIPSQIKTKLVPIDLIQQLEETRTDENRWDTIFWAFLGAILGIIINWVTQEPFIISKISILSIMIFLVMAFFSWKTMKGFKDRAKKLQNKIINIPMQELDEFDS